MKPFTLTSELRDYMPLPRGVIELGISGTALLIYAALLDRATLSRKNNWADALGRVYVIYPIEKLAETLHISTSAVKRHLNTLEEKGLIRKDRPIGNSVNRIFLNVPEMSCREVGIEPSDRSELMPPMVRVRPSSNKKERTDYSFNYKHKEEESL